MKKLTALLLAMTLLLASACGGGPNQDSAGTNDSGQTQESPEPAPEPAPPAEPAPEPQPEPAPEPEPEPVKTDYEILDPKIMPEGGSRDGVAYAAYDGVVEHLFFHPVIAYTELAFDGDAQANGLDDYMVTVDEFNKILDNVYQKGYVLVDIGDVWSETTGEDGQPVMVRNTLYLPEGKKPLVFSYDDTNYYPYMLEEGFTSKLVLGEDGEIWAECTDPYTQETFLTQDLDAITILDKFIREHPDFSPFGVKGCLSLTGYEGILGYRTQNDIDIAADDPRRPAFDANRKAEQEAVKPIIQRLKDTGWYFGSHTWGHINLSTRSMAQIQRDTLRWAEEVGSLIGPTNILFYPHGARPDGDHDQGETYGEQFKWLQSQGFRIFASVGINSYSQVKQTISAVICDRLHPDGTTLRWGRSRYLQFYDAKDIIDLDVRPDLGYDFSK